MNDFLHFLHSCKAKQPLRGMDLQEKEEKKDEKHTGKLFRKNLQIKDAR